MSWFDQILTQPIFNLLGFIYAFVADFGVAIIIMTILIRILLWPLLKKQLHQTKLMREIQPELKKIKKRAGGNRMLESTMMLELYKERGVKPFSSLLIPLIQLPIFIAIFRVIQIFSETYQKAQNVSPEQFIYPFLENLGRIPDLLSGGATHLFGLIDLTKTAGSYFPALILAIITASLNYFQMKMTMPSREKGRGLRAMFREAASGKEVDQSEIASATTGTMLYIFPAMMFLIALALPAAVTLYYAVFSLIGIIQQKIVFGQDVSEMEKISDSKKKSARDSRKNSKSPREKNAIEAEIIETKPTKKNKNQPPKTPKPSGGKTVVRRIKAK